MSDMNLSPSQWLTKQTGVLWPSTATPNRDKTTTRTNQLMRKSAVQTRSTTTRK